MTKTKCTCKTTAPHYCHGGSWKDMERRIRKIRGQLHYEDLSDWDILVVFSKLLGGLHTDVVCRYHKKQLVLVVDAYNDNCVLANLT